MDPAVAPLEYNYRTEERFQEPAERPVLSCFLRVSDRVFHTYSAYGRGTAAQVLLYRILDLTALGRQEDWEEPKGRAAAAWAWVHLFVHYDGKGDRGEQAASWLDRACFAEPATDHQAGDIQPLDWQLRRIYSTGPCCWPSSMPSCAC